MASHGLMFGLLIPGLGVLHNWYQGLLVHARRTRPITESVAIFLLSCSAILWLGVQHAQRTGLHTGLAAFTIGALFQAGWLWVQSRKETSERLNVYFVEKWVLSEVKASVTLLGEKRSAKPGRTGSRAWANSSPENTV